MSLRPQMWVYETCMTHSIVYGPLQQFKVNCEDLLKDSLSEIFMKVNCFRIILAVLRWLGETPDRFAAWPPRAKWGQFTSLVSSESNSLTLYQEWTLGSPHSKTERCNGSVKSDGNRQDIVGRSAQVFKVNTKLGQILTYYWVGHVIIIHAHDTSTRAVADKLTSQLWMAAITSNR